MPKSRAISFARNLRADITSHQLALEEWACEKVPLDWASGQNNFAHAMALLADRNARGANLEVAWRERDLAARIILSSKSAPLIARAQFVAQLCRTIAARNGWTLSDMPTSDGFEGTPP